MLSVIADVFRCAMSILAINVFEFLYQPVNCVLLIETLQIIETPYFAGIPKDQCILKYTLISGLLLTFIASSNLASVYDYT